MPISLVPDDDERLPARRAPSYLVTAAHALDAFTRIQQYRSIADTALFAALQAESDSETAVRGHARHDWYANMAEQWEIVLHAWLRRAAGVERPLPAHIIGE